MAPAPARCPTSETNMTDINELAQRLEKLEDAFNKHCQEKALCSANVSTMLAGFERLNHTVYGNGKEGLTTITARMDERLASVQECLTGLPKMVDRSIDDAVTKATAAKPEEKKLSPADNALKWFTDKILPSFVTGLFIIMLQA